MRWQIFGLLAQQKIQVPHSILTKLDRPESQVECSGAADQEGANQRKNAQPLYAVKGWMSLTDKCVEKEHNLKLSRSNTNIPHQAHLQGEDTGVGGVKPIWRRLTD